MAKGDVINGIVATPTGTSSQLQPAAGVEIIINEVGTNSGANDMQVGLYDGSISSYFGAQSQNKVGKIGINNSIYLRGMNYNAGAMNLSYCGVQVK